MGINLGRVKLSRGFCFLCLFGERDARDDADVGDGLKRENLEAPFFVCFLLQKNLVRDWFIN